MQVVGWLLLLATARAAPPPQRPAPPPLLPAEAYRTRPHGSTPRVSDSGVVAVLDFEGSAPKVFAGPADGSASLAPRADTPRGFTWWDIRADGTACVFVGKDGALTVVPLDGSPAVARGNVGGDPAWVVPLWARDALLVAVPDGLGGLVVKEWPLQGGAPVERFKDALADDVVFDTQLHPRFALQRWSVHDGSGVTYDDVQVVDPAGKALGAPFKQVPWIEDRAPVPRVGDGPVHVLGGEDLVALGVLGAHGFEPVWTPPFADATHLLATADGRVTAVGESAERLLWHAIEGEEVALVDALARRLSGDVQVDQRTPDDRYWIVRTWSGAFLWRSYLWDRKSDSLRRLGRKWGPADTPPWRTVEAARIPARDGLPLVAYLAKPDPAVYGEGPWPLVADVHGGPWSSRDTWTWDADTQRLVDRGYAVLKVEFRGTRGFGWKRIAHPWDDPMLDDIDDGIDWAIAKGVADPKRLAVTGASFGGWAALRMASREGARLRCAVSGIGPADLTVRDGHMNWGRPTPWLLAHSPAESTARLSGPVLTWTGGKDGPNPDVGMERFVERAQRDGKAVTWVRYPEEGHGLSSAENRAALVAITHAFLAECLGGRAEPVGDLTGAALEVRAGAERVPGLAEAAGRLEGAGK